MSAAGYALAGALGASGIAAVATVVSGILSRRHDRRLRLDDKRLAAYAEVIAAAHGFRTRAKTLARAGELTTTQKRKIRVDEIDAYMAASWRVGSAAQAAEIFFAGSEMESHVGAVEAAFGDVSRWVSKETANAVQYSGRPDMLCLSLDDALAKYDRALTALISAAQHELKIR